MPLCVGDGLLCMTMLFYVSVTHRKKKRAQERQKKMMEKMAKMQNRLMDKIEKKMSKEGG